MQSLLFKLQQALGELCISIYFDPSAVQEVLPILHMEPQIALLLEIH